MDRLVSRAYAAYFRRPSDGVSQEQPNAGLSGIRTVGGMDYVVLRNIKSTLAVYRVRNDGQLKGMKRWPRELDD